jgi:hypothetical protein
VITFNPIQTSTFTVQTSPHGQKSITEDMLTYRDRSNLEMEIEIDNEGDVTGVVSTDQEVLMSSSITLPAELSRLVTYFRLSAASGLQRAR